MKNYWQPLIDNWIIKESQAASSETHGSSFDTYGQSSFPRSTTFMQSNANDTFRGENPYSASDVDEEEQFDKLSTPYKGIKTLKELNGKIKERLQMILDLSKFERKDVYRPHEMARNPYEAIIQMMDDPELKMMLEIASQEIKKREMSV